MKIKNWFKFYSLPLLSGFLIGTSYIPFPPWALFFCLIPLFLFIEKTESLKKVFFGAWMTQYILNLIGFHWIAHTAAEFGHLHWTLSTLVLLAFCSFAHLQFPLSALLFVWLKKKAKLPEYSHLWIIALCFLAVDSVWPMIFRWHLGYPWIWAGVPAIHFTEFIGFIGLHVYTVFFNVTLIYIWRHRKENRKKMKLATGALFSILIFMNIVGILRKDHWSKTDAEVKFLMVQGNIGNVEKVAAEVQGDFIGHITDTYYNITREGLAKYPDTEIVVWPETAFPEYLNTYYHRRTTVRRLKDFLREQNVYLMTGAYTRDRQTKQIYNSLYSLKPNGDFADEAYHKTILLAFGEYLPLGNVFPELKKMVPFVSDFGRGKGPTNLEVGQWNFGPQICYEGLFPSFSASLAHQGAEILVNITNDSWFGYPFEPYQHLYMTFARALEFGRPLVRGTNTGLTTGILADGTIIPPGPRNTELAKQVVIKYKKNPPQTFYSYFAGYWFLILILSLLITVGIYFVRSRKH